MDYSLVSRQRCGGKWLSCYCDDRAKALSDTKKKYYTFDITMMTHAICEHTDYLPQSNIFDIF